MMMITQYFGTPSIHPQIFGVMPASASKHQTAHLLAASISVRDHVSFLQPTHSLIGRQPTYWCCPCTELPSRRADMLKDIGMNTSGGAIFLPHSPGNVADVSAEVLCPTGF